MIFDVFTTTDLAELRERMEPYLDTRKVALHDVSTALFMDSYRDHGESMERVVDWRDLTVREKSVRYSSPQLNLAASLNLHDMLGANRRTEPVAVVVGGVAIRLSPYEAGHIAGTLEASPEGGARAWDAAAVEESRDAMRRADDFMAAEGARALAGAHRRLAELLASVDGTKTTITVDGVSIPMSVGAARTVIVSLLGDGPVQGSPAWRESVAEERHSNLISPGLGDPKFSERAAEAHERLTAIFYHADGYHGRCDPMGCEGRRELLARAEKTTTRRRRRHAPTSRNAALMLYTTNELPQ
ncbi:MAG: hypothetical protein WCE83_00555 [Candidatus Baltobacteraceae bacterium]